MIRVIINGKEMDTFAGTDIAQTKQTNDIANLETKQTNYTNSFDLPKTPKNVANMEYLSLVGNTSEVPYQRNECYLYDRLTGECFVYKGWAIIKESTDVYKTYVYDGNLDLYKTIENFLLKDLDLTELAHAKDLATVIASWSNPVYRYILADYGGKTSFGGPPKVNIDYLTPSVRVKWLWDKLFEYFGITYSGSVFQTEDFTNMWMTYPKGLNTGEGDILVLESDDYAYERQVVRYVPLPTYTVLEAAYYAKALTWDEGPAYFGFPSRIHMMVGEAGTYRVDISGTIEVELSGQPNAVVLVGKNTVGILPNNVTPIGSNIAFVPIGEEFTKSFIFDLNAYDKVSIVIKGYPGGFFRLNEDDTDFNVSFTKVNAVVIDFSDAFIDFSATDFVKEVMAEFGLSLFKDKYRNHYEFLTMEERLQTADVEDWSNKYQGKIAENYIYGGYAQRNVLKHKYNEDNASYNDGSVSIDNVNLPDQKTLFQSKVYSPERDPVDYFGRSTLVYKTFDKNIKDDGTITYKSLDKRFYFMKSIPYIFSPGLSIGSEQLGTEASMPFAEVEAYGRIAFKDIITNRYSSILNVLNKSQLVKVLMNFNTMDIANLDFRKLYHISRKDINGYFMLNKISSYRPGQKTVTELVRVIPNSVNIPAPRISFGNDFQDRDIRVGDTVDIWLNAKQTNLTTQLSEEKAIKVSEYHYRFTPDRSGIFNITMTIDSNGAEMSTNTILLTVNP